MRKAIGFISFVLALGFTVPAHAQRMDVKNIVDASKGLIPITRANTAATGAWVDLAAYSGVMFVVQSGLMDATAQYIVLQDSIVGSAVAAVDSVDIGPDSTTSSIAYRGRGRYVRVLLRASGNAADSSWVSAAAILGGKRAR
jgi:hypothetical protein